MFDRQYQEEVTNNFKYYLIAKSRLDGGKKKSKMRINESKMSVTESRIVESPNKVE